MSADKTRPTNSPNAPVTVNEPFIDVQGQANSAPQETTAQSRSQSAAGPVQPLGPLVVPGYEILGELGRGGMGVVYKARQVRLNRLVALKMILAGGLASPEDLVRFRGEAEAVGSLQHPNIVQIYEVGEIEGRPYFSLEFCGGGTLADRLTGKPWPAEDAARLVLTLARAVHAAHQAGIIHRDLKPANVLLASGGREPPVEALTGGSRPPLANCVPKITDFGLAKNLNTVQGPTRTGDVMGTPSYMAPEQASGESARVGPATDVYALGAILYECLTGRPPFNGATSVETVLQVINGELVPVRSLQPHVPRDLETLCLQCLRREPGKRPASALALADDLQRFLDGEPIKARRPALRERALLWMRKRPTTTALLGVGVGLLLLLVVGGFLYVRSQQTARANVLVQTLMDADLDAVPRLLDELSNYRGVADKRLRQQLQRKNLQEPARLRLSLALLDGDREQLPYLRQRMLDCTHHEFTVVCTRLEPYKEDLIPALKEVLHDGRQAPPTDVGGSLARFHSGLALARYAVNDVEWTEDDLVFLTTQLLECGRDDQRDVRSFLRPLAERLLTPLRVTFLDERARGTTRLAAADALADLGRDNAVLLAELVCQASNEQYDSLRPRLLKHPDRAEAIDYLKTTVSQQPDEKMDGVQRVPLGKRRSGAATALLHLGETDLACSVLHCTDDPEAMTQLIHRVKERGVSPALLEESLNKTTDARVRYALLLALGEYALDELPSSRQESLMENLRQWYRNDPSAAVHSACAWLLRRWGLQSEIDQVERESRHYDPSSKREWFIELIGGESFTFVVFPPTSFTMGSPPTEASHQRNEKQHRVQLTRAYALSDRELTWRQFAAFAKEHATTLPEVGEPSPTADHPVSRVTYAEAVLFCRWLTARSGQKPGQQCYDDSGPTEAAAEKLLKHCPLHPERAGFRLPTEAEWERACRAGTSTAYSFGNDRELLRHYGCHLQEGSLPAGSLRPNLAGLFDVHGNVWEWCHDWYRSRPSDGEVDPLGPEQGNNRVLRGGGWDRSPWHCRSAYRHSPTPHYRASYMGFRLARTLPRKSE